ncbi:DUF2752 domain-containing protein [Streptomyces sp. JJ36]|uniref:DUF2752 domain-containing protein n=1 Tax=Streptomyces sp. JJ36 TaxID=2736645 RepID=UPI001F23EE96|nr:DUF2752 domain-containing protein [Streptomyces sp. JJ36]
MLARAAAHPLALPAGLLAGGLAGAVYLYDHNPHEGGHLLPRCPFNWATGLLCPACGGTRMAYDLLHLDVSAAFHDNAALLLLGTPLAGYLWWRRVREGLRGRRYRPEWRRRGTAAILCVAVTWTVARNVLG